MNVSTMIALMRTLSIGENSNDPVSDQIALNYLNLAHDELYRETANLNSQNFKKDTGLVSVPNSGTITLTRNPFSIERVYPIGFTFPLKGRSITEFEDSKFFFKTSANPVIYNEIGTTINFYPFKADVTYTFDVLYALERTILDVNTPETSIPYPYSYQSLLVEGGLYYLFQDEGGFRNPEKANQSLRRWLEGKAAIKSYFYGSNKQLISSFSDV